MQKSAKAAVQKGLHDLDKRQGYRGPLQHLPQEKIESFNKALEASLITTPPQKGSVIKAVVIDVNDQEKTVSVRMGKNKGIISLKKMRWARIPDPEKAYYEDRIKLPSQALKTGDVILAEILEKPADGAPWKLALEQIPDTQAALLCLETGSGLVKAMIGGYDFTKSQFNRAIQARRQPGSAFKPLIYSAALDYDDTPFTPATVLIDSPIVFTDAEMDFKWKPKNYKKKFFGPTLLRDALSHSRNVVTIKLVQEMGVNHVSNYVRRFGINSPIAPDLSMALGSSELPLLEVVTAYSVFANKGFLIEPCFVTKIIDRDGRVLEECHPEGTKAIEETTAYVMTHLMEGVVQHGTGWREDRTFTPVMNDAGREEKSRLWLDAVQKTF